MSFRIIAAGAGMLAAFAFVTTAIAAAETAGSNASTASTQTRVAKPVHRATRPQREAGRSRHSKRARLAARHRQRPRAEVAEESIQRPAAAGESAGALRQETTVARRFREFLNPQSFTESASEELRSPQLRATHFSGEIADPETVLSSATEPVTAEPPKGAPPTVASDQTTLDDSPNKAPALAQSDPVQVTRAAPRQKGPGGMSFLGWFFIAWGGVLTFASAVRMAVG